MPVIRFDHRKYVVSTRHGDTVIVLDANRGRYYTLDEVASRIWELLDGGASIGELVHRLEQEYDVAPERLKADVTALVNRLLRRELLERIGSARPVAPSPRSPDSDSPVASDKTTPEPAAGELYVPGRVSLVDLLYSGLLLTAMKVGLATVGVARVVRGIHAVTRRRSMAPIDQTQPIDVITQSVTMAGALYPGRALCLEQSLALYWRLRWRGVPARLRLGVQPHPLEAHAWVEHRSVPIHEDHEKLKRFVPMPEFVR
jgi:hypothetical protein